MDFEKQNNDVDVNKKVESTEPISAEDNALVNGDEDPLEHLRGLYQNILDLQAEMDEKQKAQDKAEFEKFEKEFKDFIATLPTSQEQTNQEVEQSARAQEMAWKLEALAAKWEAERLDKDPRAAIKSIEKDITDGIVALGEETSDTPSYWSNLNKETGDMLRHVKSLSEFALRTGIDDSLTSNLTGLALQRIRTSVMPAIDKKIELLSQADAANTMNAALAFGVKKKLEDIKAEFEKIPA